MKRSVLVVLALLFSFSSFADDQEARADYTGYFTIKTINLEPGQNGSWVLFLVPEEEVVNPGLCENPSGYVVPMNPEVYGEDYPYPKERYSALLSAFMTGKKVNLWLSASCSFSNQPLVTTHRLYITK